MLTDQKDEKSIRTSFNKWIINNPLNCTESNKVLHTIRTAAIPNTENIDEKINS